MKSAHAKELIAHAANSDDIESAHERVRRLYRCALVLQKFKVGTGRRNRKVLRDFDYGELTMLPERSKDLVRRMALLSPDALQDQRREVMSYFDSAVTIHKKAETDARRIWQRVLAS